MEKTKFRGRESVISPDPGKWRNYPTWKLPCLKMLDHFSFPLILTLFLLFVIWKLLWLLFIWMSCEKTWYFILSFHDQRIFSLRWLRFLGPSGCCCFIVITNNSCNFSTAFVLRRCYCFVANRHNVSLNGAWRNLIWWKVSHGRDLECDDL